MLETIWFFLWGLLWALYFMLDGFDMGLGMLLPCVARTDAEKRVVYNAAGPFWDANEVWLITAGGVTFAAFPKAYAVLFSALYAPLLILLFALIFRAVSYEFRGKVDSNAWRGFWDCVHFLSNLVPSLLLGVAFANLFMGIPVDAEGVFHGTLGSLLNIYGVAGAAFFAVMFVMHGALWLAFRSTGAVRDRALGAAMVMWRPVLFMLLLFLALTAVYTRLYDAYLNQPVLLLIPAAALAGLLGVYCALKAGRVFGAWCCSALFILGVTFFGVTGMFPGMIISSIDPLATVTAFNGASSRMTLKIMLAVALCAVPVVLLYQLWVYRTFSHTLDAREISRDSHAY